MRLIKHCSPEPTNFFGEQAFSPGFKSASKRDDKLRIVQYRCSRVTFFSYLRSVEKMCRGDFTFFSVCFLPCGLISLSLLWHFHCCVTKVCIILPRESTLMKLNGPRKPDRTHKIKSRIFLLFQLMSKSKSVFWRHLKHINSGNWKRDMKFSMRKKNSIEKQST